MEGKIVIFPAAGLSHLVPMVELAKLILHRHPLRFSVTVLLPYGPFATPAASSYIHRLSQLTPPSPSTTFLTHPMIPPPFTGAEKLPYSNFFISALPMSWIICSNPPKPPLGIPTYHFFTSGAAALAFFLHFPTIHDRTTESFKDLPTEVFGFPGLPPLKATHMPELVLDRDEAGYHGMLYFSQHLPESNGIIANTFEGFEPKATQAIEDGTCLLNRPTPPIYYMGPLIGEACEGEGHAVTADQHCSLTWLDTQPTRSVVFLCFGSRGTFLREQIKEIAKGLENSGQSTIAGRVLGENQRQRIGGEGMGTTSGSAESSFTGRIRNALRVNSVLEAVVAGVPMVAWPLYAEQQLNKAVLVEDMKMAIGMEESNEDGFVSGKRWRRE
ncbi:UDP-glycosyltransferase 88F3 [Vitis vinifera]|uniref:UDP-glycosyltransferase 88F3 n=1 Tax=Vitis vinifera TaxID=29760 RepID=A0A438G227_VITVI|nr:UDP-glycosyltransferase 88F3 [Vitis vinifera]